MVTKILCNFNFIRNIKSRFSSVVRSSLLIQCVSLVSSEEQEEQTKSDTILQLDSQFMFVTKNNSKLLLIIKF